MRLFAGMLAVLSGGALLSAGCSTRVSLGGDLRNEGGGPVVPPWVGSGGTSAGGGGSEGDCSGMVCGAPCRIEEDCNDGEPCSAFLGFCDQWGACMPGPSPCSECEGQPCGAPCRGCNGPDCEPVDPGGALFCDGLGLCAPFVYCEPCQPNLLSPERMTCGEPCDPCLAMFPFDEANCSPPETHVCNGFGYCEYSPIPECPPFDSCQDGLSVCGSPCSTCAPSSPTYEECILQEMSGPPLACDASLSCVPTRPIPPDCM